MKTEHTPTPWKIDDNNSLPLGVIADNADGDGIAEIGKRNSENLANASFIVRAVNSHDALVAAVATAHELLTDSLRASADNDTADTIDAVLIEMNKALKLAEG